MRYLDLDSWNRKEQYDFFRTFDNPYYNICVNIDITRLLEYIKVQEMSFSFTSLYLSLKAANEQEFMRYRIHGDQVIIHDVIHAGQTILNEDKTFSFCYFEHKNSYSEFHTNAMNILEEHRSAPKRLNPAIHEDDLIHYSSVPWVSFNSISHARKFDQGISIPKIVFGKYFEELDKVKMPFSIEVHHALVDGYHVGEYLSYLQNLLNDPENYL